MVYPIAHLTFFPFLKLWVRKVRGLENLKKEKSFIFAANHASFADDLLLPNIVVSYLNSYMHMYCNDAFYKNFFLRKFLEWARCIPIRVDDRGKEGKKVNEMAFNSALKFLKKDEPVGIFPEGHRSIEGKLRKAKTGIAKLALTARVPVVPVGIIGSKDILPKGAKFPKLKRCEMNIGKPVYPKKYFGKENNKKVLKEVTTLVMKEIAKLAKLEYNY